jgi:hypothetical protein
MDTINAKFEGLIFYKTESGFFDVYLENQYSHRYYLDWLKYIRYEREYHNWWDKRV